MPVNMKGVIADAFVEMSRHKSVDKITVTDLVENCHISRQTFYYHFKDIMDVVEWVIQRAAQGALEKSLQAESDKEALALFLDLAEENQSWIRHLLLSQRRVQVERIVVDVLRSYLKEMFQMKQAELSISQADLETALDFFACGTAGLLLMLHERKKVERRVLVDQIYRLLTGGIVHIVPASGAAAPAERVDTSPGV